MHNRLTSLPALDDQLCVAVYRASHAFTGLYRELLASTGLSYPQYVAMLALWESDTPLTVKDLGEKLALDSGTLSPLLRRLEQAGHLRRIRDEQDGRRVHLQVTPQGWTLRESVLDIPGRLVACVGGNSDQARDLIDRLHAVTDHLRIATGELRDQTKDVPR